MATERISWTSGAPTTEFLLYADRVGQDKAKLTTTVRLYIRAYNRGGTSSYYSGSGEHSGWISGYGTDDAKKTGTPFLPSGVASDARRWEVMKEVDVQHGSDGKRGAVTLNMKVSFGSNNVTKTLSFDDFPDIDTADVPPPPTAKPLYNVSQHSMTFNMDNNGNGGASLDNGEVWVAQGQPYADAAIGRIYNTDGFVTDITGLRRFTDIYVWGSLHNRVGWSRWSNMVSARTAADKPQQLTPLGLDQVNAFDFHYWFRTNDDGCDAGWAEYQVGYGTDPNNVQATMNPGGTDARIGGLQRNTHYYVWVRGRSNANIWSDWSDRWEFQTAALTPNPTNPILISEVTQTGFRYQFGPPGDDGGAAILEMQVAYGTDPNQAQYYVSSGGDIRITGLRPATDYYIWSRARNQAGWGPWSWRANTRTSAGARVKIAGVWREVLPLVKSGGSWKIAQPFVKRDGVWKRTA
jgi:hypothetical protein